MMLVPSASCLPYPGFATVPSALSAPWVVAPTVCGPTASVPQLSLASHILGHPDSTWVPDAGGYSTLVGTWPTGHVYVPELLELRDLWRDHTDLQTEMTDVRRRVDSLRADIAALRDTLRDPHLPAIAPSPPPPSPPSDDPHPLSAVTTGGVPVSRASAATRWTTWY
eukprot:TRINITY_DN9272_c0_g1_i1.p1 TRINITY_DN9272_c0_g1~~TRINITY_DN9272_c0_g1_i1.p1  ORF type:complete len:167 (-),score=19.94 TRINITY_DN9272_c0_g1_i1:9-509(-)